MEPKFNVKLHIKNYKQIGTDVPFEKEVQGDVLLITGDNNRGKTGLVNALVDAWALKSSTPNPLTNGTDNGFKKITIPTLDGESITIVHNFTSDNPTGMFYGIKEDGKIINSVPALRKLIGDYAPLTVEQFFADMQYSESRKKLVKNYLVPLMGDIAKQVESINKQINENGILYKQRTEINSELRILNAKTFEPLTETQNQLLAKEEEIKKAIKDLSDKQALLNTELATFNSKKAAVVSLIQGVNNFVEMFPDEDGNAHSFLRLLNEKLHELSPEMFTSLSTKLDILKGNIDRGNQAIITISNTKQLIADKEKHDKAIVDKQKEKETLEATIEALKLKRVELIKAANLPAGIETDGENITLKGFDFLASSVSYSEAALAIAEIMAQLFSGKIITLGNISEFGPANRARIFEIAKKYNKLVVVTQVTDESEVNVQAIIE